MAESLVSRIRHDLETRILSGAWPPGHRVPVEHELMVEYGCSRMTVSKAVSSLVARGLVSRRRGAGSFVAQAPQEASGVDVHSVAAHARRAGKQTSFRIMSATPTTLPVPYPAADHAAALDVLRVVSLHAVNGIPIAVEDRVVSLAAFPDVDGDAFATSAPGAWLERHRNWPSSTALRTHELVRAVRGSERVARWLRLSHDAPCLAIERTSWDQTEWLTMALLHYAGDQVEIGRWFHAG